VSAAPSILVTGATGFVGRHFLLALAASAEPHTCLALVRDAAAWRALDWTEKLDGVDTIQGSVLSPDRFAGDRRLASVRTIVHLAAVVKHSRRGAEEVEPTNVEGTLAMVRLAARLRARLVFVSTSGTVACFATRSESADEDAPHCEATVARWPYYRSKVRAEREARRLAAELGVELAIVRPPIVLGPGDHRFRSTSNVLKAMRGKLPIVIEGGIAFVDVRDVAQALVRIVELPRVRPVYHLPGTSWGVTEFFAEVEAISGLPGPRIVLPFRPAWLLGSAAHALGLTILPDPVVIEMASRWWDVRSRYAEADLGYRPRDPRETLADTIAWLREHAPT
jgi:dihydroflavonol-4-reductase